MPSAFRSFPPAPESVGRARRFATRTLESWGAGEVEDDVRVVASELATNALLHARTEFTLALTLDGDRLRLTITDHSAAQPRMRRFDSTESTTGRGLRMVTELTRAWGVETDGVGKAVWCEFDLAAAAADRTDRAAQTPAEEGVVELTVDALLALYGEDDGEVPHPRLSTCGYARSELVVRVVA